VIDIVKGVPELVLSHRLIKYIFLFETLQEWVKISWTELTL